MQIFSLHLSLNNELDKRNNVLIKNRFPLAEATLAILFTIFMSIIELGFIMNMFNLILFVHTFFIICLFY